MPETLEARRTRGDDPIARSLLAAVEEEFGVPPTGPSLVTPAQLSPPGGFFVALVDGWEPIAGGGVRAVGEHIGEIKRMYVVPDRRGGGLAHRLLREIEGAARDEGYARLRLDTFGTLARFYESSGYVPIPDYNGNTYATFWGEKAL